MGRSMLSLLGPIASVLGLEINELTNRLRKDGLLWAAIALFALVALAFGLVALNAALTLWVGAIWAPLIVAGGAALVAIVLYAIQRIMSEISHRREVQRRQAAETTALVTTATVTALPVLMKSPLMRTIGLPLGGALAALYLLSKSGGASGDSHHQS